MSNRYKGSNISPFVNTRTRVCMDCTATLPIISLTKVEPVPGLTMYRCPACVERCRDTLAAILAYAKWRWCWDDATLLEELYQRDGVATTPEAAVDAWAYHYDLLDPREQGL
jgi:hypothetical protein